MPLFNSLKINDEERELGTNDPLNLRGGLEATGEFIGDQYQRLPENVRGTLGDITGALATGARQGIEMNKDDPFTTFDVLNAAYKPIQLIKDEASRKTGLDPIYGDATELAVDLATPIPFGKAKQIVEEVFDYGLTKTAKKVHAIGPNPNQFELFGLPTDPKGKAAFARFNDYIARKSGYESMAEFRKNVMNKWPQKDQDQLFRQLWEGQGEGYIEHLTAKGSHMDWYWDMKGKDRNAVSNVRILYNDNLKNLKDTVEKILYGTPNNPGLGWQGVDPKNRLIVSFEDPQRKIKKDYLKQNPGDIIIKRAGNDEIIGNLGQYLDTLYPQDPLLKKVFEEGVSKLGLTPAQFRRQVLSERIEIIIRDSYTLPKNATKRKRYIKKHIDDDLADLTSQYPFLKARKSITEAMDAPGSGVTEADYNLRGQGKNPIPPLGDPKFQKGGPFKGYTKTLEGQTTRIKGTGRVEQKSLFDQISDIIDHKE